MMPSAPPFLLVPLFALLLAVRPLPGLAADTPPARTLAEVAAATLASEESLRIAQDEVRRAELRSRRYFLFLTPDVRATGAYTHLGSQDSGNGGGQESSESWAWALTLNQPLYTGGRATAAYRGQKDLEGALRLEAQLVRRALLVSAAEAYYRALAAAEAVRISKEGAALASRQLALATRRVELGDAILNDQLRAEVSLRRFEAELAAAESALAQARETVRRLSGLELAADPEIPPPVPPVEGDDATLVAEALAARLEPRRAQLAVSAAEQDVREKQGRFLPSLALNASWGEAGERLPERDWNWSAGVVLEVPIYQRGSTPYEVREAKVGLDQERLRSEAARRDIEREVRTLLREIEASRAGIASLRRGVDAAAENLRLGVRRYEVGLADSLEVADAQNADVVARVALATAGYRLELLGVQLRSALGREPLPGGPQVANPR
jgi:outer membrane protein TolC